MSLRLVRSPVAPQIVITQGAADAFISGWFRLMVGLPISKRQATVNSLVAGFLFHMPAKLVTHRGQDLARKIVFAARGEALVKRGAEHRRGRGGLNGGEDRPSAFPGIGNPP